MAFYKRQRQSIYNYFKQHLVKILIYISIFAVAFSFVAPYLFTLSTGVLRLQFDQTGPIGDTIGGLMNPFIALSGVCVTFLAFYMQFKANNIQVRNFRIEQRKNNELLQEQLFFRLVDNLKERIVNFSHSETHDGNIKEFSSYTALNNVTKAFNESLTSQLSVFGKKLLATMPDRIPDVNLINIINLKNHFGTTIDLQEEVKDFKFELKKRNEDERWEYLKFYTTGDKEKEDSNALEALASIAIVMFYKLDLFEKEELYFNAYYEVYNTYGGFIDGYIRNLHYMLRFFEKNDSNNFFSDYTLSNMTTQESIIIFYYCASRKSSPDFKKLVRKYKLLDGLIEAQHNFIASPTEEELTKEIEEILYYEAEEFLNFLTRTSSS